MAEFINSRRYDGVDYLIDFEGVAHPVPQDATFFPGDFRCTIRGDEERTSGVGRGRECQLVWEAKEEMFYIDRHAGSFDTNGIGGAICIPLRRVVDLWAEPSRLMSRENALELKVREDSSDTWYRLTEPKKQGRLDEVAMTLLGAWRRPSQEDISELDDDDDDREAEDEDEDV